MYIFASYGHSNSFGPKPCSTTAPARQLPKVAVQPGLNVFAGGRPPSPRKVRDNPFKPQTVFSGVSCSRAVHQNFPYLRRYLLKRYRFAYAYTPAESFNKPVIENIHSLATLAPGIDSAAFQRDSFIRHNQVGVKFQNRSKAVAALAGTIRAVKAKKPRRQLLKTSPWVFRASEFFAVDNFLPHFFIFRFSFFAFVIRLGHQY